MTLENFQSRELVEISFLLKKKTTLVLVTIHVETKTDSISTLGICALMVP